MFIGCLTDFQKYFLCIRILSEWVAKIYNYLDEITQFILIKDILSGDKKKITYSAAALTASALFTAALGYAMATAKKSLIWEDDDEEKKKQAMYA